jgi:ABC-2 type transport system ATP-binding protein
MRDLLRRLARRATVILSTHIMQEVEAVCDRVLVMAAGRLVLDAPLADLRKSRTLVLRAGTEEPDLERWLRRLPQIAAVHPRADIAGGESWVLTLRENADADTAANNIAQCVVRAGASLFQLQPQLRDLDSIFRDATSGKAGT